jgi:hypothetical protein
MEMVTVAEQLFASFDAFSFLDDVFYAVQIAAAKVDRHAQLA